MKWGTILWLLLAVAIVPFRCVAGDSLVVVATRYLQAEGASHAHLYLYREDGTIMRQLTRFEKGHDQDPLFSLDGKEIVFARSPRSGEAEPLEYWRVATTGEGVKRLDQAPEWYRAATKADHFTPWFPNSWPTNAPRPGHPDKGWERTFSNPPTQAEIDSLPVTKTTSPDGKYELILKLGQDDLGFNGPGNGALYELRNLKTGKNWRLGELPGFVGLTDLLHAKSHPQTLFLQQGALNVVFFSLHMGSTDGDWWIALDLNQPGLHLMPGTNVPLPPTRGPQESDTAKGGFALPIPLPGEPSFLALGENRYEPIPGSQKTANISYLTRFDAELNGTPYVRIHTAPIFYGASLYRPGKMPKVMKIGRSIGWD